MISRLIFTGIICICLVACGEKKKPSLAGEEPVEASEFIQAFEPVKPTYEIADSLLHQKVNDSLRISYKVFTQFVPDSILAKNFGKNGMPKIYMLKSVDMEKQETYLFTKAVLGEKKIIYVLCFDKKNNYLGAMPLLTDDGNAATLQVSGIDRRYSIFKNTYMKRPDGSMAEGKEVYAFNADSRQFMLIMTEALDDRIREVINPIDTLPRNNKISADYVRDKMNLVSVRDGSKPDKINFFIHFDRNNGECTGELKGIASLVKPGSAIYRQPGDGCVLEFTFTSSTVSLKESEPCGSHRGVKCSFDGSFPRKKEPVKNNKKK
jgi:hypothetical protein